MQRYLQGRLQRTRISAADSEERWDRVKVKREGFDLIWWAAGSFAAAMLPSEALGAADQNSLLHCHHLPTLSCPLLLGRTSVIP